MPSPRDTATRLVHLEELLAQTAAGTTSVIAAGEAATVHLNSVPLERIRRLTAELHDLPHGSLDVVDAVVLRLLLDEFTAAVTHLRAVAGTAAARVDGATQPLREAQRDLHRLEKRVLAETAKWSEDR